jgi:hypothetical protein
MESRGVAFDAAWEAATNPETRTPSSITTKIIARQLLEGEIRTAVKAYITYNPAVTDADRENMQLPLHDTKPTPKPPPAEASITEVDFSKRQQHQVIVKSITGRAKPLDAHGFEVWRKIGNPPPASDADFSYAGFNTRSPFTVRYGLEDVGKTVYYRSHWVNEKNEPGPWSEVVSAVIA